MRTAFRALTAATVLGCFGALLACCAWAGEPGPLRLSRESFLVALGTGGQHPAGLDIKKPTLYLVVHGFWRIEQFGRDLGESHSIEFDVTEPFPEGHNQLKCRWDQEHKSPGLHHDTHIPLVVAGYDIVPRKISDKKEGSTGRPAGETGLYAVLFTQKYSMKDRVGVRCWMLPVAASSEESARQEAVKQLSTSESDHATVESVVALDSIQGYAVSLRPKPVKASNVSAKQPAERTSCSLFLSKSQERGTITAPKLYAGVFGTQMNGEDQGVVFMAADKDASAHEKEQRQWGQKMPGFPSHAG